MEINGIPINYIDTGGEGRTALFLHGWGAHIGLYGRIFELLAGMGWRVLAFDMPGVGGTPEPPQPLTVEDYCDIVLEFCRRAGVQPELLLGHSHGGRVSLRLLGLGLLRCPRAVLIDSAGIPSKKTLGAKLRLRAYKVLSRAAHTRLLAPLLGGAYERARERRSSADYRAASPVMRQTMNNILAADMRPLMPDIRASVLLVWGENDADTPPENGREMERLIPGAGLALIRGAGHFCFADNWRQFAAVLEAFLK